MSKYKGAIEESLVKVIDSPKRKEMIIEELAQLLFFNGRITNPIEFTKNVLDREVDGMTGLMRGIAIPHAKLKSVLVPSIAIARLSFPIEWNTFDQTDVHTVFLLAGNYKKDQKTNNNQISALMKAFAEDAFFEEIHKCSNEKELYCLVMKTLK